MTRDELITKRQKIHSKIGTVMGLTKPYSVDVDGIGVALKYVSSEWYAVEGRIEICFYSPHSYKATRRWVKVDSEGNFDEAKLRAKLDEMKGLARQSAIEAEERKAERAKKVLEFRARRERIADSMIKAGLVEAYADELIGWGKGSACNARYRGLDSDFRLDLSTKSASDVQVSFVVPDERLQEALELLKTLATKED